MTDEQGEGIPFGEAIPGYDGVGFLTKELQGVLDECTDREHLRRWREKWGMDVKKESLP